MSGVYTLTHDHFYCLYCRPRDYANYGRRPLIFLGRLIALVLPIIMICLFALPEYCLINRTSLECCDRDLLRFTYLTVPAFLSGQFALKTCRRNRLTCLSLCGQKFLYFHHSIFS